MACFINATESSILLPVFCPIRLGPPQPRPITLTFNPVRPNMV